MQSGDWRRLLRRFPSCKQLQGPHSGQRPPAEASSVWGVTAKSGGESQTSNPLPPVLSDINNTLYLSLYSFYYTVYLKSLSVEGQGLFISPAA